MLAHVRNAIAASRRHAGTSSTSGGDTRPFYAIGEGQRSSLMRSTRDQEESATIAGAMRVVGIRKFDAERV